MKLIGNSIIYVAVSILQRALGFFLLPIYTAYLKPEDYGTANVVQAIVNFAVIFCLFSFHGAGTRFEHTYRNDPESAKEMWGTLFISVLTATGVVAAILFLFRRWLLVPFLGNIPFYPYMAIGIGAMMCSPVYHLFQANLQAKQLGRRFGLNNLCYFFVNMGLTLLFITVFKMQGMGILLALALTNATFFLYTLIDFLPRINLRFNADRFWDAFKYSLPLLPHSLAGWVMNLVDRLFLNHFQTASAVGVYSVGIQFGNLINILTAAVNQAYAPWMFEQFELGYLRPLSSSTVSVP
jgi:O-antigen/teichoic acid export membrane protein